MEEQQEKLDFKVHEESGMKYREYEVEGETLRVFYSDSAKRLDYEEYEEYRFRRQVNKYVQKQTKKGRHFWPSVVPTDFGYRGNTYNKEKAERVKQQLIEQQKEESNEQSKF